MTTALPHTIQNSVGEKITFHTYDPVADKILVDASCAPGAGPAMHTHHRQEEELTVVSGRMGYEVPGQEIRYAGPGETVLFKRGTPHRFWAEGTEPLHCHGWLQPANSIVFFLSTLYAAQTKSGRAQPDPFIGAYLLTRYASEYDMPEIPGFVKKVVFPLTVILGRLLGKYREFDGAPEPLR